MGFSISLLVEVRGDSWMVMAGAYQGIHKEAGQIERREKKKKKEDVDANSISKFYIYF